MCHSCLYQALIFRSGNESGYAAQALASAVRLKDHAGKQERMYIEAAVAASDAAKAAGPDGRPNDANEVAIWRTLVKKHPDDLQAKIFL
jgi:hypothetical protein